MGALMNLFKMFTGGGQAHEAAGPTQPQETPTVSAQLPTQINPAQVEARRQANSEALAVPPSTPAAVAQPAPAATHGPVLEQIAKLLSTLAVPQDAISKIMNFITQFLPAATPAPVANQSEDINGLLAAFEAAAKDASAQKAAPAPAQADTKPEDLAKTLQALEALAGMFGEPAKPGATPTAAQPATKPATPSAEPDLTTLLNMLAPQQQTAAATTPTFAKSVA